MNFLDCLSQLAANSDISDIHFHQDKETLIRVSGDIVQSHVSFAPTKQVFDAFIQTNLDETQLKYFEEKGDFDFAISLDDFRFRVSVAKANEGYVMVCRKLSSHIPNVSDLSLPPAVVDTTFYENGLVLVTGPTGSGKSTTLASLISAINKTRAVNILTIEDPIEFIHKREKGAVFQRQIGRDTSSFSQALRAALREDPDVILVGEMRDLETISLALTAAETGHLVFGTLHTNGGASTINRIIDAFPPEQQNQIRTQLGHSLKLVVTQQLHKRKDDQGRVASFEVMRVTTAIANLIRENKIHQINNTMSVGAQDGMLTMEKSIQALVAQGLIDG